MLYTRTIVRSMLAATAALLAWTVPATSEAQGAVFLREGATSAPPTAWLQQDPADSLYRAAREALNRSRYREAAQSFHQIRDRYPRSGYAADAYYWEAFALDRLGSKDDLSTALRVLEQQKQMHEAAATLREAEVLATRIRGKLARMGDANAAERVARDAARTMSAAERVARDAERSTGRAIERRLQGLSEDDALKMAALNALIMMDPERAVPLLTDLIRQREGVSPEMRQRALMVLAQHRTPEAEEVLFEVLQNDPDPDVQGFALIWLSQSSSERALDAIASILANSNEPELQHRAIVALAQQNSPRAQAMLRDLVQREEVGPEARTMAIMMLGQHNSAENLAFLRDRYRTIDSPEIKARIVHALAMSKDPETQRWLLDIALSENEPVEVRQQALFMASQTGAISAADLIRLYDGSQNEEVRQHLLYAMSQHKDPAVVDKMIAIARSDPNPEMRQRAIMWLSQSKDPRVPDLLMEIIRR